MKKERDLRNFRKSKVTASGKRRLRRYEKSVSEKLPKKHIVVIEGLDSFTGNPNTVVSKFAPKKKGNYTHRALEHLHATKTVRGLTKDQASEYKPSPVRQETSTGAVIIHVQQQHKGINIFQTDQAVLFGPSGALERVIGSSITIPESKQVSARIPARGAVLKAADHIVATDEEEIQPGQKPAVDLSGFVPEMLAFSSNSNDQTTFFNKGPFADKIKANLVWFPLNNDLRLAWEINLALPDFAGRYRVLIDANTSRVLYCRQLNCLALARGNVHPVSPAFPRQMVTFPLPASFYGISSSPPNLAGGFPDSWVHLDSTVGNCSFVNPVGDAGDLAPLKGVLDNGVVVFNPTEPPTQDQELLDAFFYTCFMHDFFYLLGFREGEGNFQFDNLRRGGIAHDLLHTRVFTIQINGYANLDFQVDGISPILNLGLTPEGRHTALDATMVFHDRPMASPSELYLLIITIAACWNSHKARVWEKAGVIILLVQWRGPRQ